MRLLVNKVHFPVTTLGHGRRLAIWVQGCSIRCPGCINRDTWAADPARAIDVPVLVDDCAAWLCEADGVTISGGEPFDQPEALACLLDALRARHAGDLLVFSGYPLEHLEREHAAILDRIDVLVSDPYVAGAGDRLALRGSDNQRITLRTPLARLRYPADLNVRPWSEERSLDVMVDTEGGTLWMAGIPAHAALTRLRAALRARGLDLTTSQHV